ncbi:MAG: N-acetylmuramoyl-L-alanine amidase [Verrucomicrobiota bacterium]
MIFPGIGQSTEDNPLHQTVDWRELEQYQYWITQETFRERLKLYSPEGEIHNYLEFLGDKSATLFEDTEKQTPIWRFRFLSKGEGPERPIEFARDSIASIRGATFEKPLSGLRICLDPGHIGGKWANIEERYFRIGKHPPVQEGDLTLLTAQLLAKRLEAVGAEVVWTKKEAEPVTSFRPKDFNIEALERAVETKKYFTSKRYSFLTQWYREFLFYRVAEIFARSKKVEKLQPDFTLCLHYNAAPWRGRRPRLFNVRKIVTFVHGAYMSDELESLPQRLALFHKLFENSSPLEIELATAITNEMKEVWQIGPENYAGSGIAYQVSESPYVWSRNVVANRTFPGPVIFVEGPYMNDKETFYRLIAGDYDGIRTIRGKTYRSIFREFADGVADGLIDYYRKHLIQVDSAKPITDQH